MRWTAISAGIGATLIVSILIAGPLGFGLAIRQRMLAPPELDLRVDRFRILAVVVSPAHSPADAVSRPCAPRREGCCNARQEFYLVWVLAQIGAIDRGHQISIRLLTLPLQCT